MHLHYVEKTVFKIRSHSLCLGLNQIPQSEIPSPGVIIGCELEMFQESEPNARQFL